MPKPACKAGLNLQKIDTRYQTDDDGEKIPMVKSTSRFPSLPRLKLGYRTDKVERVGSQLCATRNPGLTAATQMCSPTVATLRMSGRGILI